MLQRDIRQAVGGRVVLPARRCRLGYADGDAQVVTGTCSNFAVSAALQMTALAWPRSIRSTRSAGPTAVVVGITTAPSLMIASIDSHSSTWLPSITTTLSPGSTPEPRRCAATWSERRASSSKEYDARLPSSSRITRPGCWLPRAKASNQSCAKLNVGPTSGQVKEASASS